MISIEDVTTQRLHLTAISMLNYGLILQTKINTRVHTLQRTYVHPI